MGLFAKKQDDKSVKIKKAEKAIKDKGETKVTMSELYTSDSTAKTEKNSVKGANAYRILVRPIITEKAGNMSSENKYVFEVSASANKIEVAKAIEEVYHVKPLAVNMVKLPGKVIRRGRITGKRKDIRKAIVTLAKGKTIQLYEGV
jgi:large subunit ribosomal protein L23